MQTRKSNHAYLQRMIVLYCHAVRTMPVSFGTNTLNSVVAKPQVLYCASRATGVLRAFCCVTTLLRLAAPEEAPKMPGTARST